MYCLRFQPNVFPTCLKILQVPLENFFHTDYHDLIFDCQGLPVDRVTGVAPHKQPPALLVSAPPFSEVHSTKHQLLVPGRSGRDLVQRRQFTVLNCSQRHGYDSNNAAVVEPAYNFTQESRRIGCNHSEQENHWRPFTSPLDIEQFDTDKPHERREFIVEPFPSNVRRKSEILTLHITKEEIHELASQQLAVIHEHAEIDPRNLLSANHRITRLDRKRLCQILQAYRYIVGENVS